MGPAAVVPRPGIEGLGWTREEAMEWYRRARAVTGRRVDKEQMGPYSSAFVRLFGSVGAFQRANGDEPAQPGRPRTRGGEEPC